MAKKTGPKRRLKIVIIKLQGALFRELASSADSWAAIGAKLFCDPDVLNGIIKDSEPMGGQFEEQQSIAPVSEAIRRSGVGRDTVERALRFVTRGLAFSFLVMVDGGSALSEVEPVELVDSKGRSIGNGLHELFGIYLSDEEEKLALLSNDK